MVRGYGRELIEQLNDISTKKRKPDLTILLDASVDVGLGRRNGSGDMDRLDMEDEAFHKRVREGYLTLAKENAGGKWVVVDAEGSEDEVEKAIWQVVKDKLEI